MTVSRNTVYLPLLFFLTGLLCIFLSRHEPIHDFGNYYYGSRLLLDGKFSSEMYTSIHYFNQQIATYGESNYFENYIPVPPFSALFYIPFCFFASLQAKLVFNLISLLFFCFSLYRILNFLNLDSKRLFILPLLFFFPLYSNIHQGQAYLLILSFLFEIFLGSETGKAFLPSFLLALIISLKIFPGFILLYFIFKKNWRVVIMSVTLLIAITLISFYILPENLIAYYYTSIVPRLFNNDVVGTYYTGNQSVYTLLLQFFSYDELSNPDPFLNQPLLVVAFESIFYSLLICFCVEAIKQVRFVFFGFVIFIGLLLSRYSTSYALVLIFPFCIAFLSEKKLSVPFLISVFLSIAAANIPGWLVAKFIEIPFMRLYGLLLFLALASYSFRFYLNYKFFLVIFFPLLLLKYFSFPIKAANYFSIQNSKGILYDIDLKNDSLILKSCLGNKDIFEKYPLKEKASFSESLVIRDNSIFYKNKLIYKSKDNKARAFLYKNSVVFMSDLNQGVRFYKLRTLPL